MNIIPRPNFAKRYRRLSPVLREKILERIDLLILNPFHPLLNNHGLKGDLKGSRSINITGDWRLVYNQPNSETIVLIMIGTHHELYGA